MSETFDLVVNEDPSDVDRAALLVALRAYNNT